MRDKYIKFGIAIAFILFAYLCIILNYDSIKYFLYKPKKQFFKMNINELKEYVNNCKNIDSINKKLIKKLVKKKN